MNIKDKITKGLAGLDDQEEALKNPETAFWFAHYVPGADIKKCQEIVCKSPYYTYLFALYVRDANIEKCQEAVCKTPEWTYLFACYISGANIEKCIETCRGTEYEAELNQLLMEKVLQ